MSARRILIVDDDADLLELLEDGMEAYCDDCHIVRAQSGFAALEQFQNEPFDLVVTDYHMPDMNGLELARTLREKSPHIPIVLMTGFLDIANLPEKILALGLQGYIEKPFGLQDIRAVLRLSGQTISG